MGSDISTSSWTNYFKWKKDFTIIVDSRETPSTKYIDTISLNWFQRGVRLIFGCYKDTHLANVAKTAQQALLNGNLGIEGGRKKNFMEKSSYRASLIERIKGVIKRTLDRGERSFTLNTHKRDKNYIFYMGLPSALKAPDNFTVSCQARRNNPDDGPSSGYILEIQFDPIYKSDERYKEPGKFTIHIWKRKESVPYVSIKTKNSVYPERSVCESVSNFLQTHLNATKEVDNLLVANSRELSVMHYSAFKEDFGSQQLVIERETTKDTADVFFSIIDFLDLEPLRRPF